MIGKQLLLLASVIQEYEGWGYDNLKTKDKNEETISFRHNNPGNLRASPFAIGTKNGFAYFYSEEMGKMALIYDLWVKCSGKSVTGLKPSSTLKDLIFVYAPPSENDSEKYLKYVEAKTGISRGTTLDKLLGN